MANAEHHAAVYLKKTVLPRGSLALSSRWISIPVLLGLLLWLHPGCGASRDADETVYDKPLQIRYGFTLTNTTNQLIPDVRLRAFTPLAQTATQKRIKTIASHPFEELDAGDGLPILLLKLSDLPPYSSKVATVVTDLLLADQPGRVENKSGPHFISAEKYVEADAPGIVKLARSLRQDDALATARQVFDWVADNLKYTGYRKNRQGAVYALRSRQGDCTEFMDLFVALCRANGIPARGLGGYICSKNMVLKPAGYHNWAEFHDGRTWRLADPQNRVFLENQASYVAMHTIGNGTVAQARESGLYQVQNPGVTVKMNVY